MSDSENSPKPTKIEPITVDKPTAKSENEEEIDMNLLSSKIAKIEAEKSAFRKAELEELEKRVDNKIRDLHKFVEETNLHGRSLAGDAVEVSEEEKAIRAAETLLKGTGLRIR